MCCCLLPISIPPGNISTISNVLRPYWRNFRKLYRICLRTSLFEVFKRKGKQKLSSISMAGRKIHNIFKINGSYKYSNNNDDNNTTENPSIANVRIPPKCHNNKITQHKLTYQTDWKEPHEIPFNSTTKKKNCAWDMNLFPFFFVSISFFRKPKASWKLKQE